MLSREDASSLSLGMIFSASALENPSLSLNRGGAKSGAGEDGGVSGRDLIPVAEGEGESSGEAF